MNHSFSNTTTNATSGKKWQRIVWTTRIVTGLLVIAFVAIGISVMTCHYVTQESKTVSEQVVKSLKMACYQLKMHLFSVHKI